MAEDKKSFLQGKMNQDLDDRVLPNGEYRSAQNIQISTSDASDIGSVQNLLGNSVVSNTLNNNYSEIFVATQLSVTFQGTAEFTLTLNPLPTNNQAIVLVNGVQIEDIFTGGVDVFNNVIPDGFNFFDIQENFIRVYGTVNIGDVIEVRSISGLETIGCFFDEKDSRVFYFVTNYTCPNTNALGLLGDIDGPTTALQANNNDLFCGIYMYDQQTNNTVLLVSGLFLNFSKTHTITGVSLIDDLLFFTDGLNQPRRINIELANPNSLNIPTYYTTEDKISVAKFAPFMPALLLDYDQTTLNNNTPTQLEPTSSLTENVSFPDDIMKEKFIRFSYRYRFVDGEYSTIAPFTQVCFVPKTSSLNASHMQKILKRGQVYFQDKQGNSDGMVNSINSVNLNIILPSSNIKTSLDINGIEILYKESNNNVIRAVELIDLDDTSSVNGVFQYNYKSTLPYKTLPPNQLPRVYDNVPLSAKAQEIVGNRVIYGNFVQDRTLPSEEGIIGLNFNTSYEAKYDITNSLGNTDFNNYYVHKEYPFHSIKQKRTYEIGVVLSDKFGRQSPVLTSTISDGSITVKGLSSSFNSSTWSEDDSLTIQDVSQGSAFSTPGNENYCGDALTLTFNKPIPNAYGSGILIDINNSLQLGTYNSNVFKRAFYSGTDRTTATTFVLFYEQSLDITNDTLDVGSFLFTNDILTEPFIGQSIVYLNNGLINFDDSGAFLILTLLELDPGTGEVINVTTENVAVVEETLLPISAMQFVAAAGDTYSTAGGVLVDITSDVVDSTHRLIISNTSFINDFEVGDYLKGQDNDFVLITNIISENNNLILECDGKPSLSYNVSSSSIPLGYYFYKYKIIPHGWYSYRVVVKQTEQDYYNVYAPGVFDFDNDRDDPKTYIPILSDNINKVTRDIEFSNTQEVGLSTSKDKLFPKVVPSASNTALSVQSNNDILDVVSIGTSKEQGVKNENDDVFAFVAETNKNPLLAQIPFGGTTGSNIGSETEAGLSGRILSLTVNTDGTGDAPTATLFSSGKKVLKIQGGDANQSGFFEIGDYLKGANVDLVKVIKVTAGNPVLIECDGEISEEYKDLNNTENLKIYSYKYDVQDNLAVFETKPVETALDIYYETSTAGLVHELNEALLVPSKVRSLEFISNFSEGILYYDQQGNFQNQYAATFNFLDVLDNNISAQDITQVTLNSYRAFVEISDQSVDPSELANFASNEQIVQGNDPNSVFEIVFVDNEWRLKPKSLAGSPQNFVHFVSGTYWPNAYEFNISLVHQQSDDELVSLDNQIVTLRLENVAPIVEPTLNNEGSVQSSDFTFSNIGSNIAYTIPATNGCADVTKNTLGLKFYAKDTNPDEDSGFFTITSDGVSVIVLKNSLLYDTGGDVIKELGINNLTGEIFVRHQFFYGVTNKTFEVYVYDSDETFFNTDNYVNDDEGLYFGKRTLTTISLIITADLIVITTEKDGGNHPYYINNAGNSINGVNVFDQDDNNFGNGSSGTAGDNDIYNCYWTEIPDTIFNGHQNGMSNVLRHSQSGENFIFSYLDGDRGSDNADLWSIKIDEPTGEPRLKRYIKPPGKESSTSQFMYFNHILPSVYSTPVDYGGIVDVKTYTIGGIIITKERGHGGFNQYVPQNIDLTGVGSTGINKHLSGWQTIESVDIRDLYDQNVTQWDYSQTSFGPYAATETDSGGFDFDDGFDFGDIDLLDVFRGAYKYYKIDGSLSGAFAHPKDRSQGNIVGGGNLAVIQRNMFQTRETINILNYEYRVVYEVERRNVNSAVNRFWVPRVFLARKGENE